VRNYPKLYWIWEAAAAHLTGQVETGKGLPYRSFCDVHMTRTVLAVTPRRFPDGDCA